MGDNVMKNLLGFAVAVLLVMLLGTTLLSLMAVDSITFNLFDIIILASVGFILWKAIT